MTVYVDDMRARFGLFVMCHMIADTTDELVSMAETIGVPSRYIQHAGTAKEHFDICLSKRRLAVKAGAVQITLRELGRMIYARAGYKVPDQTVTGTAETRMDKAQVIAAVERAIERVNTAVDLQFRLPIDVLAHLVSAQSCMMRALHVAKHPRGSSAALDKLWHSIERAYQRYEKEAAHG